MFTNLVYMVSGSSFKHCQRNVCRNLNFQCQHSKCSTEELLFQILLQKLIFRSRIFFIIIADPDIGSKKFSPYIFVKHFNHIVVNFKQNRIVRTIKNFELFDKKLITFWQSIDAILDDFLVTEKMLDATLSIQRLSSFSLPKSTVIRYV